MFTKKKTFVEICFTERELDILKEAEKIITNLIESSNGDFCNQQTGEVITYADVDKIVQEVDFDIFVTGPDQCHQGFKRAIHWCEENGREHIVLARTDGISSSELKAKIAAKSASV